MTLRLLLVSLFLVWVNTAAAGDVLRLATTTSTQNSGLLERILPDFLAKTGTQVHVIAVGTGKALRMGQDGDVDVVLVHAPAAEEAFVQAGYGVGRRSVMFNDFILVGPPSDPAGVAGGQDVGHALLRIADQQARFVSRGDDSGTHKKERALWQAAGRAPDGDWYMEVGQGMGKTLQMASEMQAYTLVDRGTWLAFRDRSELAIVAEGDERMRNAYGVIAVNPARYPEVNRSGGEAFIAWLVSPATQALIADFRIGGEQLFHPLHLAGR